MGRVLYIFSFLVLFANVSFAQTTFSASGRVLDENNNPLPMASILIFNALDSSFVVGSTTSIDGRFTIKYIKKGNYNIKLTYVGYSDLLTDFEITNSDFVFQDLVMKSYSQDLMQVTVKATQTRITLKGDTIEYNANAYKVNNDAMAEDLLKKMPGISVVNGKVQAQGEDVKRVTIDGNEFFGDDAYIALRNLPAEIISKIQVVEGKSDQSVFTGSMDANTFKLINIITQNPNAKKTFGKLYSGYGTDSRFNVGGNMNFFNENQRVSFIGTTNNINLQNFSSDDLIGTSGLGSNQGGGMMGRPQGAGGISLFGQQESDFLVTNQSGINQTNSIGVNYIDKLGEKISLNGSYFYNGTNNNTIASLKRNYFFSDESLGNLYTEDYRQEHINHNHRFRLRMEYEINARNKLIFIPKVSFQILKGTEAIFAKNQFSEQQTILETSTKSEINNDVMSISGDILYTHKFLKEGRTFSVNLSSNKNNSNNSEKLNNLTYNMELDSLVNIIDQTTDLDHRTSSRSANFIFTERLSNKFSLSFNYNPSHSLSESVNVNNLLDTNTGNYSIFDSIISNSLSTKIITHIVGSTLQFSTNKTTLSAAMSFQNQLLQGNYIFPELEPISKQCNNLMPTLMFMHRFNSSTNLRVILKSGNTLPSTNQLQEFLDNSNPLQLYIGNSELNPESYKMLLTRFSTTNMDKNRSFFAFLMFQFKNDYIGKSTYRAGNDTVIINRHTLIPYSQLTTYENLSNYYNLRSFFTYSFPIPDLKSNLNLNGSFGYNITPGKTNEIESIASNINSSIGCVLSSNISHNLDYNFSYNFSRNWMTNSQLFSNNNNTHKTSISFTYSMKNRLVLSTEGQLYLYQGFENLTNENPFIVNLTLGYKFFERNNLQAQFSIYDLFKQNIDFISSTTAIYIEETKTNVLQQYFLISFIYKMNN